eukprot:scaffold4885_cov309-Prasinococcus_capsulatus_cf.AAC.3
MPGTGCGPVAAAAAAAAAAASAEPARGVMQGAGEGGGVRERPHGGERGQGGRLAAALPCEPLPVGPLPHLRCRGPPGHGTVLAAASSSLRGVFERNRRPQDIAMATEAGMASILPLTGVTKLDDLREERRPVARPTFVIDSLASLGEPK